jgi:hypothetical protein
VQADRRILECELLVTQFQRGNQRAFEQLVRMWEQPLFYYATVATSEADTWTLQETAEGVSLLARASRTLSAFLYTIARNTAISRQAAVSWNAADRQKVNGEFATDDVAVSTTPSRFTRFDQLPLLQREALTLFSSGPFARGCPRARAGGTLSRVHYAKRAMRKILHRQRLKCPTNPTQ